MAWRLWLKGTVRLKASDPLCRTYSAKGWRKTYTVKDQPRKLEIGTPKYPAPWVQIQFWRMVEAIGSRERSQATIMNDATSETATAVKSGDLRRTSPTTTVDSTQEGSQTRRRMVRSGAVPGRPWVRVHRC